MYPIKMTPDVACSQLVHFHDTASVQRCSQDGVWMVTDKKMSCNVSVIVFVDPPLIIGSRYRVFTLIGQSRVFTPSDWLMVRALLLLVQLLQSFPR